MKQASPIQQGPTIDVAGAAVFLGLSQRTVRRLIADRAIPHRRFATLVRFTQQDLDDFVAGSRVSAEA